MRASAAIAAGALALSLTSSVLPDRTPKPMRSECIVGFRADWTGVASSTHAVFDAIHHHMVHFKGGSPSSAYHYDTKDSRPTRLYFQFLPDCASKRQQMEKLLALWRAAGIELPRLEYIDEPILPGPHTIDDSGPAWADGRYYDYYNQWQNPSRGP